VRSGRNDQLGRYLVVLPVVGLLRSRTPRDGRLIVLVAADSSAAVAPNLWKVALSFVGAALVAFVLLRLAYRSWSTTSGRDKNPDMSLPGLAATWTFRDSWATNATVITAAFTGVFGTKDVTQAILGDQATGVLALALVAAALSVGLAGLGPMVLQAMRKQFDETSKRGTKVEQPEETTGYRTKIEAGLYVTPRGLLAAAFCTLTATGGQLATIVVALFGTRFRAWAIVAGGIGYLLLLWYSWASTQQNLTIGAKPPTTTAKVESKRARTAGHDHTFTLDHDTEVVERVLEYTVPAPPRPAAIL
jgi:hypothetical protein